MKYVNRLSLLGVMIIIFYYRWQNSMPNIHMNTYYEVGLYVYVMR